jgi:hypothetical protein
MNFAPLVDKYMGILGIEGPRPDVAVRSHTGSRWLGRCSTRPNEYTSLVEVQRSVLDDPRTLERVFAHEMVHHAEYTSIKARSVHPQHEFRRLRRYGGHGQYFRAGAALVDAVMGAGYVTEKSDEGYVVAKNTKKFFAMILPPGWRGGGGETRWAWAIAVRLSPEARAYAAEKAAAHGARLVTTTDDVLLGAPAIRKYAGVAVAPAGSPTEARLKELYLQGGT